MVFSVQNIIKWKGCSKIGSPGHTERGREGAGILYSKEREKRGRDWVRGKYQ